MIRELLKGYFGGKEPVRGIEPDEAVVHAIAVQDNIFSIDERLGCFLTINDYPLRFGVETTDGALVSFTRRDDIGRYRRQQNFSFGMDDQSSALIRVYEGLQPMAKDNRFLVEFDLHNISLAPSGVPQIQITFEHHNGETTVTAASGERSVKAHISCTQALKMATAPNPSRSSGKMTVCRWRTYAV
jgi:heat shock protein 5